MKSHSPMISVIVPTYNRANMLADCIDAVIRQNMQDLEIIVVSDGSTDNTKEVIAAYNDPRLLFFEKENGGQASARNLGIIKSRGKYISLCDDDDRFYPDHLGTLCRILETDSDIGLVYSDAEWVYKDGSEKPEVKFCQDFDKKSFENYNYITTQTVLFRKICLKGIELFDESLQFRNGLEDWEFFLRLSDVCRFLHLKKITAEYVVHNGNSFHPNSGYDYNRAFFTVRTRRFQFLLKKYDCRIFEHVDHMYPYHLVQCYLNNEKYEQAFEIACKLNRLYNVFKQQIHTAPFTELFILFSLCISSFAVGRKSIAEIFINGIFDCPCYKHIELRFVEFVEQYVKSLGNINLKAMLVNYFLQ